MSARPVITDPEPGSVLDYSSGTVTFRWSENGGPHVKQWSLSLGDDGVWNIRNHKKDQNTAETILVFDLPTTGKVWAQVYGKVDGRDKDGNLISHDEEIESDPVFWYCP